MTGLAFDDTPHLTCEINSNQSNMQNVSYIYEKKEPSSTSLDFVKTASSELASLIPEDMRERVLTYEKWQSKRLAFELDSVLEMAGKSTKILECGSFPLIGTYSMALAGLDVYGLDIAADRFNGTCQKLNLNVRQCDFEIEPIPYDDNSFDIVLLNEVFEHLRINLIATLTEIRRVLRPNGVLALSTPNLYSASGLHNFIFHQTARAGGYSTLYDAYNTIAKNGHAGHIREYTPREVSDFLVAMNFQPETIAYRGEYDNRKYTLACWLFPKLRPTFSIFSRKL